MRAELLGTIGNILTKPIAEARKKRYLKRTAEENRLRKISADPLNVTPEDIERHETECLDRTFWSTSLPINIFSIPVSFLPIAFFREQDRWEKLTLQQRRDETFQAAKQEAIELKLI